MKKFFTLIAAVAMAASMNAQGTYAVAEGDEVTAGKQITSVANVTLTYMENAGTAFAVGNNSAIFSWLQTSVWKFLSSSSSPTTKFASVISSIW